MTLRQVAEATRISVRALESLERNDIARLPGGIFSRAFVRAYAVEVGLAPEETVQEFIAQFPDESVTAGHPTAKAHEDFEAVEGNRRAATTFLRRATSAAAASRHRRASGGCVVHVANASAGSRGAFISGAGDPDGHTSGDVGGRLTQARRHAVREPRLLDFRSCRRRKRHPADAAGGRAPDDRCQAGARADSGRCGRRHVDAQWC
jgi:hypothetical protein